MTRPETMTLGIAELGRMLRSGEVTARGLAVEAMERLDTVGRSLNAVVTLTGDRALAEAEQADRELAAGIDRGPLHGIPYGAKDLLAVAGHPTTWGAAPFVDQQFDADATAITRMREAGAVLAAKLAMVELAGGFEYIQPHAAFTGPGRNGRDPERWAGGSSSGSGAVVAAGCLPIALGSETWGSITNPATLNGITGFRPTYGMISRHGAMALSWTLDKIGPLAHSAADCEAVVAALAGPDSADPSTRLAPAFAPETGQRQFRFAHCPELTAGADPLVAANFARSLDALAEIGTVEEIEFPQLPYREATGVIIDAEAASAFEEFIIEGRQLGLTAPENRYGLLDGLMLPAVDYLRALRIRRVAATAIERALEGYDAIVAPVEPRVAPPINAVFTDYYADAPEDHFGAAGNLCGLPGIALPNGAAEEGLPSALLLMGLAGRDASVLAAGKAYQRTVAR
jgi:aspartyl-tRNA(Asn)/glutamyl-tRNA(Gln) amidotransferase subunit A